MRGPVPAEKEEQPVRKGKLFFFGHAVNSRFEQVELDDDDCIDFVSIDSHTSCWGDSGLGEEDPEDFWSFEMCLSAAEPFIENILE